MRGFLCFLIPALTAVFMVVPGVFDSTMMSRLAVYPLLGSLLLYLGRENLRLLSLVAGLSLAVVPSVSLLWSQSPLGGLPFAVRWFSFGLMIAGFSGTVAKYGIRPHLDALAAAAVVSALILISGMGDAVLGNPNRTGMLLVLGFIVSLDRLLNRSGAFWWAVLAVITAGLAISAFVTAWISAVAGTAVLFSTKRLKLRWTYLLFLMIAGQVLLTFFPRTAGRTGPTLELRTRIWRYAAVSAWEHLPLGTGTGTARINIFTSAETDLQELAGEGKRVDYMHSEPLALITESGIPGLLSVLLLVILLARNSAVPFQAALLTGFWPIFATDLPLATPLGALPIALLVGWLSGIGSRDIRIPGVVPLLLLLPSAFWCYSVLTGYGMLDRMENGSSENIEATLRCIPWEERAYLTAAFTCYNRGDPQSAVHYTDRFLELYPTHYRCWELRATALAVMGRNDPSAWSRAALLSPVSTPDSDVVLMVLNSVPTDPSSMSPDTACMLSGILKDRFTVLGEMTAVMSEEEMILAAEKLLLLSEACLAGSGEAAAVSWMCAFEFAFPLQDELPAALRRKLQDGLGLLEYLTEADWIRKAGLASDHLTE